MFKYDSPLMTGLRKFLNLLLVSAVWLLCSLPVVTAGASASAFYHTIEKYMKYDVGYALPEFFQSFRQNFRAATKCWLILLAAFLVCFGDIAAIRAVTEPGAGWGNLVILFEILLVLLCVYTVWVIACVSRFHNTTGEYLKNGAILAIGNLPVSLAVLFYLLLAALVVWLIPVTVLVMPGVALWLSSYLMEKVFQKILGGNDV